MTIKAESLDVRDHPSQKAYNAGKLAINAIYVAEVKEAARKAEADRVNSKNKNRAK